MKVYTVGGAVRDKLLGLEPKDKDYLVIGSTTEEMRNQGFIQVDASFPIFIHPKTRSEYAFPRGISLEEDLYRRDLTINAMAIDDQGKVVDPFGGMSDLKNKVLRHVSNAFAEDPFRVYRVIRFHARYPDFTIAAETLSLIKNIILTSEFKKILPERIIKELNIVLGLPKPSMFFEGLKEVGALEPFFTELDVPVAWNSTMYALDEAAKISDNIIVRYAALTQNLEVRDVQRLSDRILAPNDWKEAAITVARFHRKIHRILNLDAQTVLNTLYEMDAYRKPHLVEFLALIETANDNELDGHYLKNYYELTKEISFKDVTPGLTGKAIGDAIYSKRIEAIERIIYFYKIK